MHKLYDNKQQRLVLEGEQNIPKDEPCRLVDDFVEHLDMRRIEELFCPNGRPSYDPRMLLKVIIYSYMNGKTSCREIEESVRYDDRYKWLADYSNPDYITINRFRNKIKDEIQDVFKQLVDFLVDCGEADLTEAFIDGTKIRSKSNTHTLRWRKVINRSLVKRISDAKSLLGECEKIGEDEEKEIEGDLEEAKSICAKLQLEEDKLSQELSDETIKDENNSHDDKKKALLERKVQKAIYELQSKIHDIEILNRRNSYSITDNDASAMIMKEDVGTQASPKPGYNLGISTNNQYITLFDIYDNASDHPTLIPFLEKFNSTNGKYPGLVIADAGYGSEQNYEWIDKHGIQSFVKYPGFDSEKEADMNNPYLPENFPYDQSKDIITCPAGYHLPKIRMETGISKVGYTQHRAIYYCDKCSSCPQNGKCKSKDEEGFFSVNHKLQHYKKIEREKLKSLEGKSYLKKRTVEPEAVFGQIKGNMRYQRFRHFGKDKVIMDFAIMSIAHNLKKYKSHTGKVAIM